MHLQDLLKNPNAVIIDVRETWEFSGGHVEGSVNIPMGEVPAQVDRIRQMGSPLIFICASGNRSGMVAHFLAGQGMQDVYNGGGWYEVERARMQLAKRA